MKKQALRLIAWLLSAAVCLTLSSGCSKQERLGNNSDIPEKYQAEGSDLDTFIKSNTDFVQVAENDTLILSIHGGTAEIKVENKKTGAEWFSNPQERYAEDFFGEARRVYAQLSVEYNINDAMDTMNSFSDAVTNYQYSFSGIDNGIRVNFVMGTKPRAYIVPQLVEKARFEALLAQLEESEAEELKNYFVLVDLEELEQEDRLLLAERFPVLTSKSAYITQMRSAILSPSAGGNWPLATDSFLEKIETLLVKAGYTQEEYEEYVRQNGLPETILSDQSIAVSVEYVLDGEDLVVRVPNDSIAFRDSELQLTKITVLPAFGAADRQADGYIFLPDGSGALTYLNHTKTNTSNFSAPVYGEEHTLPSGTGAEEKNTAVSPDVYMPVFGMKNGDEAFLAIIEQGDALAEVTAQTGSENFTTNIVYADFRMSYTQKSTTKALSASTGLFYQEKIADSDIVIRYRFLHGEAADYVGMATAYRTYLLSNGLLNKREIREEVPLFISLIQAVNGRKNTAGIPVDRPLSLTSGEQAVEILRQLKEKQVTDLDVELQGWCNGGYYHTAMNRVRFMRETGGRKGFAAIAEYAEANRIGLFPSCDFQSVPKRTLTGGFSAGSQAARTLENIISYKTGIVNSFGISTPAQNTGDCAIVSPAYYDTLISSFLSSYKKLQVQGVSAGSMGYSLGGDYREGAPVDRQKAKELVTEALKKLADETGTLAVEGANLYALQSAGYVYDLTTESSRQNATDETIPFYQIVLHGVVPYAGQPLNQASDLKQQMLRCIETGTIPSFLWMYEENIVLKNTGYTSITSACYTQWLDKAAEVYREMNAALSGCMAETIVAHARLSEYVSKTVYGNGVTVYVNYSEEEQTAEGVTVPKTGYLRVEKQGG